MKKGNKIVKGMIGVISLLLGIAIVGFSLHGIAISDNSLSRYFFSFTLGGITLAVGGLAVILNVLGVLGKFAGH